MKPEIRLSRAGHQCYTVSIPGHGIVTVKHASNPNAYAYFRWNAYGRDLYIHGFTLREVRSKLGELCRRSESA